MTRRLSLLCATGVAVLLVAGVGATPASALDLECEWTGAGLDANWSTADNWVGCGGAAPGDGDRLSFPAGAPQLANINDLVGVVLAEVRWDGDGYTVSGNPIETADLAVEGITIVNADVIVHQPAGDPALHLSADLTVGVGHGLSIQQGAGQTMTLDIEGAAVLDARLGGSNETLVVIGDGTLSTRGNTYAGTLVMDGASRLSCGGADCGPSVGPLSIDGAAALEFTADTVFPRPIVLGAGGIATSGVALLPGAFDVRLDGLLTVAADAAISGADAGSSTPLELAGGVALGGSSLTLAGDAIIPAFASLTSTAAGSLHVGGPFGAGSMAIDEGQFGFAGTAAVVAGSTLVAGDALALGPDGSAPTSVSDGGTLGFDGSFTIDESMHLDAASRIATLTAGSSVTVNHLVLHDGGRVETEAQPSAISLAGVSGSGPLHLASAGDTAPILFDAGGTSSYTGTTVAESGTVALNRDTAVTGDLHIVAAHVTTVHTNHDDLHDAIPDTATLRIDGGELVVNDNERVASLVGAGGAVLVPATGSGLTIAGSTATSWGGDLRGHGALIHEGTGSLRLDGDWIDAADGSRLLVESGFVLVHGSFPETDATVQGRLGGTGTLRSVSLDGGVLAPGDTGAGCMDIVTSIGGLGTMDLELGGLTPCSSDLVTAERQQLAQADWSVSFVGGFTPSLGDVFTVVTTSGVGSDAIPEQDFVVGAVTLRLSADADRVILTVIDAAGQGGGSTALAGTGGTNPAAAAMAAIALLAAAAVAALAARRRTRATSPSRAR